MRASTRRLFSLAAASSSASSSSSLRAQPARFLTPGNPTGLTGLPTHPCPRSTLIYLYSRTLAKLGALPASSAYRAAATALTQHRLDIVKAVLPPGYAAWAERARNEMKKNPQDFGLGGGGGSKAAPAMGEFAAEFAEARIFLRTGFHMAGADAEEEWDGEDQQQELEGPRSSDERKASEQQRMRAAKERALDEQGSELERSPPWEASQISEIETKVGSGLIEEVIEVAEREHELVNTMAEYKVWEEMQDKAPAGQWEYHGRDTHMPRTQEP